MRETILDGATCLLGECCEILNYSEVEYIIVGGWSPFLLNSEGYLHPGTKDVDILFKKGLESNQLEDVINEFLDNGFIQSAKHPFQLLKTIDIKDYKFIYNVDLLHPDDQEKKSDLFVDHIDFPIKESEIINVNYKGKTIRLPKSDLFFSGFYDEFSQDFCLLNGETKNIKFNLLNESGLILSKLKSVFNEKRTRDAYDIYLALEYSRDYELNIKKLKNIISQNISVKQSFENFLDEKHHLMLDENINNWKAELNHWRPNWSAIPVLTKFKNDLGI